MREFDIEIPREVAEVFGIDETLGIYRRAGMSAAVMHEDGFAVAFTAPWADALHELAVAFGEVTLIVGGGDGR